MTRIFAVLLLALFALAAPASAQTFPPLTGRVVDQADILRPEQEIDLSSKSEALEAQTGRQFVVATVKSLEGQPIEDYAYRLGPRLEDRRPEEGRRRHPARRSERAQGVDRDRLWRRRIPDRCDVGHDRPRRRSFRSSRRARPTTARGSPPAPTRSSSRCRFRRIRRRRTSPRRSTAGVRTGNGWPSFIPAIFIMIVFFSSSARFLAGSGGRTISSPAGRHRSVGRPVGPQRA